MAKVISFVSRKGGTGKTTNAINIATTLTEMGYNVVVIETDVNYTLSALRERERRKLSPDARVPDLVRTEETGVAKMIKTFQKDGSTDYIIVDSGGNTTSYGINRLCVSSDLVVVPTSLSVNDVMVAEQTLNDVLTAHDENPSLKVVLLPNRVHSLTNLETVKHSLAHLNVPILDTFVPAKKSFTYTSTVRTAEGYKEIADVILKLMEEPAMESETAG